MGLTTRKREQDAEVSDRTDAPANEVGAVISFAGRKPAVSQNSRVEPHPENAVQPVAIRPVHNQQDSALPNKETHAEALMRDRREDFVKAHFPDVAKDKDWAFDTSRGGSTYLYKGKPALALSNDSIVVQDSNKTVLAAAIAAAAKMGWTEISIDTKDQNLKALLTAYAQEAGLKVAGVHTPAPESEDFPLPGMGA